MAHLRIDARKRSTARPPRRRARATECGVRVGAVGREGQRWHVVERQLRARAAHSRTRAGGGRQVGRRAGRAVLIGACGQGTMRR
eukprot:2850210-Prymnesium_polylepis.1